MKQVIPKGGSKTYQCRSGDGEWRVCTRADDGMFQALEWWPRYHGNEYGKCTHFYSIMGGTSADGEIISCFLNNGLEARMAVHEGKELHITTGGLGKITYRWFLD